MLQALGTTVGHESDLYQAKMCLHKQSPSEWGIYGELVVGAAA
jgi:hypothetical protein